MFTIADVSRYRAELGPVKRPVLHFLSSCKGRFYAAVKPYLSEEQFQLLAGLMFGDTSLMDESLYEQFRLTGIAHVLAVSGLHVGLLYAVVLKLLKGRSAVVTAAVSGGLILVYAALCFFVNTDLLTVALNHFIIYKLVEVDILYDIAVLIHIIGHDIVLVDNHPRNLGEITVIELGKLRRLKCCGCQHQRTADTHHPFCGCAHF
ncbi:MAG: ComEC/Rec2 family competence protein [Firmicutes bacterium]|nr:ComEC/Rec2 family competence protein [Bacillota bacterium]